MVSKNGLSVRQNYFEAQFFETISGLGLSQEPGTREVLTNNSFTSKNGKTEKMNNKVSYESFPCISRTLGRTARICGKR